MDRNKPYLAVLLIQLIYTAMFLLSKAAFNVGMNNFIFTFYRQAIATVFLIPLAFTFERKKAPPLSFWTSCKIFLLSLVGVSLSLDIYGVALVYTTPTLAASTTNCLPVITFFVALLLRMETLRLKTLAAGAKLAGIAICLGGSVTLAFYKGPHFGLSCNHGILGHHQAQFQAHTYPSHTWVRGVFLMLMSNTCFALWMVLQGRALKIYPSKLLFTTLSCFFSSIQTFVIAIAVERDPDAWKLGWNICLVSVVYCGIAVTGITFYLQTWVIERKGPVFLAMSTPLNLIFTMLASLVLLCDTITLGSILGGLLLIGGLYSVLWGKSREEKMADKCYLPEHHHHHGDLPICSNVRVVAT